MATEQEILELVYRVKGQEEGKALEEHLARGAQKSRDAQAQLDALTEAYERGYGHSASYRQEKEKLQAVMAAEEKARTKTIAALEREAAAQERATDRIAAAEKKAANKEAA